MPDSILIVREPVAPAIIQTQQQGPQGPPGPQGPAGGLSARQSAKVDVVYCPLGATTPVALMPCPTPLVPHVTRIMFACSIQLTPQQGCKQITPSINLATQAGAYAGNIAYWNIDRPTVGDQRVFGAQWLYDPRLTHVPPDVDLDTGAGKYLGLHVAPSGAGCFATSSILQAVWGPIPSITADETSTSLLDGKGS